MAGFIQVPADGVGKRVDTVTLTDATVEVHRQKLVVCGGSGTAEVVVVTNAAPAGTDMGLVVRQAGTATVAGTVNVNGGVAISGTATVAGSVIISGTATVAGVVNISATAQVAIATPFTVNDISRTVQVAVATPFTINNISASVAVATGAVADFAITATITQNLPLIGIAQSADTGAVAWGGSVTVVNNINLSNTPSVVLAAGTANFGILDSISKTVQVAVGTPFTVNNISATTIVAGVVSLGAGANNIGFINNISATVIVAGVISLGAGANNIGFINNISATVTVAGNVNISATPSVILAAGTAVFGTLNDISRTVQVAVGTPFIIQGISTTVTTIVAGYTPAIMAASHGPKCVTASTSANVTLIATPGAGFNIYVTQLMVGNNSATLTKARIGTSASIATVVMPLAASGGGFVFNFDPPWMLSASEACLCSVKPNVADAFFTVNFFVK